MTTNKYIHGIKNHNWQPFTKKLWQRNYWEHVIRNKQEMLHLQNYIINNPAKWDLDCMNHKNTIKHLP